MGSVRKFSTSLRERVRPLVAITASACLVSGGAVAVGALAAALPSTAGAAPSCNEKVDPLLANGATFSTIQAAIDAPGTIAGHTICVYPGVYNADSATARDPNTGGAGSNDFNIFVNKSVTIQGLDGSGNAIASAPEGLPSSAAPIIRAANVRPTFGSDNIFVQADNVTLRGLEIDANPNTIDKSVEIVGNGDTVTAVAFTPYDVGIYISDFHFNPSGSGTSTVKSYSFTNNTFDGSQNEAAIYVASGAGWSGPASGRVISGNKFNNLDDAMDFAGTTASIAWLPYPVGTATITGNTFSSIARRHLLVFGDGGPGVGYVSPNWCGVMSGNTFDRGAFTWQAATLCPGGSPRTWASGGFNNVAGLYSAIQQYAITKSIAGDTVQVLAGTYDESLSIGHALTLVGANAGVSGTAARGPESAVVRLAAETGSNFNITTASPVVIDGFNAQFNATPTNGDVLLSLASGNVLTFRNNVVNNSTYVNTLLFDDSAASATFTNNLFTNLHQTSSPGTGVVATWGDTGTGTQAAISYTGNTFSLLTDNDGVPAINLNTVKGVVSGNTFSNIHQYGILLADKLGPLSITGNSFDKIFNDTPLSSQNRGSGIRTFTVPNFVAPVTITQNTFTNSYHGVRVANDGTPADLSSGNMTVNRNAFTTMTNEGISVAVGTIGTLNGTCNWWGAANGPGAVGPGSGTTVSSGVAFQGWLISSDLNGGCPNAPVLNSIGLGGPTSVIANFTPATNSGTPNSFTVTCVSLNGHPTVTATGSGSPITVTGLVQGAPYQCTVTETNPAGTSAPSNPVIVLNGVPGTGDCRGIPTAPTALTTAPGNGSATVSWAPSTGCVAGYIVTPYIGSSPVPEATVLLPGSALHGPTTTVVKGLTNGVAYKFTVAAENGFVAGPASVFTGTITVGVPAASSVTHVARVAKGAVQVAFKAGATNGSPIKSFTATCTSSNGGVTKSKSGKRSPIVVNGLTAKKTYRCTVTATNSRGTGPASRASSPVKS